MKNIVLAVKTKDGSFEEIEWEKVKVVEIHTQDNLIFVNGEEYLLKGSYILQDDKIRIKFE